MDRNRVVRHARVQPERVALLTESVDRNTTDDNGPALGSVSLSSRRAWIEIPRPITSEHFDTVALLTESVDRNVSMWLLLSLWLVALLTESVDRNAALPAAASCAQWSLSSRRAWIEINWKNGVEMLIPVALLTESVDRNPVYIDIEDATQVALLTESVDRNQTGIEAHLAHAVALLTESVDRNQCDPETLIDCKMSLSSRRAWIEIMIW